MHKCLCCLVAASSIGLAGCGVVQGQQAESNTQLTFDSSPNNDLTMDELAALQAARAFLGDPEASLAEPPEHMTVGEARRKFGDFSSADFDDGEPAMLIKVEASPTIGFSYHSAPPPQKRLGTAKLLIAKRGNTVLRIEITGSNGMTGVVGMRVGPGAASSPDGRGGSVDDTNRYPIYGKHSSHVLRIGDTVSFTGHTNFPPVVELRIPWTGTDPKNEAETVAQSILIATTSVNTEGLFELSVPLQAKYAEGSKEAVVKPGSGLTLLLVAQGHVQWHSLNVLE